MEAYACRELTKDLITTDVYKDFDVIGVDEAHFFQDVVMINLLTI